MSECKLLFPINILDKIYTVVSDLREVVPAGVVQGAADWHRKLVGHWNMEVSKTRTQTIRVSKTRT